MERQKVVCKLCTDGVSWDEDSLGAFWPRDLPFSRSDSCESGSYILLSDKTSSFSPSVFVGLLQLHWIIRSQWLIFSWHFDVSWPHTSSSYIRTWKSLWDFWCSLSSSSVLKHLLQAATLQRWGRVRCICRWALKALSWIVSYPQTKHESLSLLPHCLLCVV